MPFLSDYIARLPAGLESHPNAQIKASVVNAFVRGHRPLLANALDHEVLRELVVNPPPDSMWISEVHGIAVVHALRGILCPDEEDFVAFGREINRVLLSGPLYVALFRVFSHGRVAKLAGSGWRRFHRGSTFDVESSTQSTHVARVEFPPHLLDRAVVRVMITAIEEALQVGGAQVVTSEILAFDDTSARFELRWGA